MTLRKNSHLVRRIRFYRWTWSTFGTAFRAMLTPRVVRQRTFPVHIAWAGWTSPSATLTMVKTSVSPDLVMLADDTRQARFPLVICKASARIVPNRRAASGCWFAGFDTPRELMLAPVDTGHPGLCPVCFEVYMEGLLTGTLDVRRAA